MENVDNKRCVLPSVSNRSEYTDIQICFGIGVFRTSYSVLTEHSIPHIQIGNSSNKQVQFTEYGIQAVLFYFDVINHNRFRSEIIPCTRRFLFWPNENLIFSSLTSCKWNAVHCHWVWCILRLHSIRLFTDQRSTWKIQSEILKILNRMCGRNASRYSKFRERCF